MKTKWFISTLLFISLCFGAFQEKVQEPNQEIVLEFVASESQNTAILNTIASVKQKLKRIGVTNILIKETKKGTLKISYYSAITIKNVKNALLENTKLALNKQSKQKEKNINSANYSLDIYELTETLDISNLEDSFIVEIKHVSDRYTSNSFSNLSKNLDYKANQLFKIAYKVKRNNSYSKDYTSYQEPEVRAGPKYSYM